MSPITDWEALAKDAKEANPGYEPAPEGNYNMTVLEVKPDVSKEGNQKFTASLVIDEGPYKGKKLWHDFVVARSSKRGLGIFFQNMALFGMPFEFFNANTQDQAIVDNIVNKRFSADLIVDTYNPEKPKNKIDKGWTIKAATKPSELDLPSVAGVPGGSNPGAIAGPPPVNNYQAAPPAQQYQQVAPPNQPQYQQPPQQYQEQPAQTNVQQQHEDPWQTPSSPPPPPSNANWGAPPPPPPGLNPGS